jgi:DNA-directed RNA polymerase subunit RPC12/RpoP
MSKQYSEYLESIHWKTLRRKKLESARYRCERCGSSFKLQVHHRIYVGCWQRNTIEDLEVVCDYCHRKEHGLLRVNDRPVYTAEQRAEQLKGQWHIGPKALKKIQRQQRRKQGINDLYGELDGQEWFQEALKLSRDLFKSKVREYISPMPFGPRRSLSFARAFRIYDKLHP